MTDALNNPMNKMFHFVEESLSYQYHKAWKYVLNVLATFFEVNLCTKLNSNKVYSL